MSSTKSTTSALAAEDLPRRLAEALAAERRGATRRCAMSSQLSYGRHAGPAPPTARYAAVMLLLFQRAGRWHLPLTERPDTLAHHAGQISLPGGSVEVGESSHAAALRELREELGTGGDVNMLGRLNECYVFASDFLITPWVAAVEFEPAWRPQAEEVQRVVELPLEVLLDEHAVGQLTIERGPLMFHAPCYRLGEARIWGATSIVLSELADVLRSL
jgi:8-oxo-dGTP pyrophosphatase MutT (NUDIX family)